MNKKIAIAGSGFLGAAAQILAHKNVDDTSMLVQKREISENKVVFHYQIVSKTDPTDIREDSKNLPIFSEGFDSYRKAKEIGDIQLAYLSFNPGIYHSVAYPSEPKGYAFVNSLDELKESEKEYLDEAGFKILIIGTDEANDILDGQKEADRMTGGIRRGVRTVEQQINKIYENENEVLKSMDREPSYIEYKALPKMPEFPQKKDKTDYTKLHTHNYEPHVIEDKEYTGIKRTEWVCKCGRKL